MVMPGLSVNLTRRFLSRLGPPKQLTSTLCTCFCQFLTTALIESAEGETEVCGQSINSEPLAHDSDALETVL